MQAITKQGGDNKGFFLLYRRYAASHVVAHPTLPFFVPLFFFFFFLKMASLS